MGLTEAFRTFQDAWRWLKAHMQGMVHAQWWWIRTLEEAQEFVDRHDGSVLARRLILGGIAVLEQIDSKVNPVDWTKIT